MRLLLIIFIIIINNSDLSACECIPVLTVEQHFQKADVVFYAKVTSINDKKIPGYKSTMHFLMDSLYADKAGYHPTLTIKNVYKGKILKKNEVSLKSNWSLCDVLFKKNAEYVVFGYYDENGQIRTSVCTPTFLVTNINELTKIEKLK